MPITFYPGERFAVFIDGANFNYSKRNAGIFVDDLKLLRFFKENNGESVFLRIFHHEAVPRDDGTASRADIIQSIRRRLDFLEYNGFTVFTKPAKDIISDAGEQYLKGNMDGEMIVDMMATSKSLDHIVIFSGDGDFRYAVQKIQEAGKRVTVVASDRSIANELKRQADSFVELEEMRSFIQSDRMEEAIA